MALGDDRPKFDLGRNRLVEMACHVLHHELIDLKRAVAQEWMSRRLTELTGRDLEMGMTKVARPHSRWHVLEALRSQQTSARELARSQDDRCITRQLQYHFKTRKDGLIFHERTPPG